MLTHWGEAALGFIDYVPEGRVSHVASSIDGDKAHPPRPGKRDEGGEFGDGLHRLRCRRRSGFIDSLENARGGDHPAPYPGLTLDQGSCKGMGYGVETATTRAQGSEIHHPTPHLAHPVQNIPGSILQSAKT